MGDKEEYLYAPEVIDDEVSPVSDKCSD